MKSSTLELSFKNSTMMSLTFISTASLQLKWVIGGVDTFNYLYKRLLLTGNTGIRQNSIDRAIKFRAGLGTLMYNLNLNKKQWKHIANSAYYIQ
jgi:hypothetical protein